MISLEKSEKPVSLREFAKMTSTSDGGVRKAIKAGSIDKGFVDGKIIPSIASVEWGKAILEKPEPEPGAVSAPSDILPVPAEVAPTREIWGKPVDEETYTSLIPEDTAPYSEEYIADVAKDLAGPNYDGIPNYGDQVYTGDEDVINSADDAAEFLKDIPIGTSKIEAERLYSVLRARKVKRELQRLEGELVDKGLVYKNLYEFAAVICSNFKNVPDRVVDAIRASDTRNEGIKILDDEINTVLLSLSGVGDIKLTKED